MIYAPGKRNQVEKVDKFSKVLGYISPQIVKQLLIDPFGLLETPAGRRSQVPGVKGFLPPKPIEKISKHWNHQQFRPREFSQKNKVLLKFWGFLPGDTIDGQKTCSTWRMWPLGRGLHLRWWWKKPCTRKIGSLSHYLQGFIHPRWCRDFFHQQYQRVYHFLNKNPTATNNFTRCCNECSP